MLVENWRLSTIRHNTICRQ